MDCGQSQSHPTLQADDSVRPRLLAKGGHLHPTLLPRKGVEVLSTIENTSSPLAISFIIFKIFLQ